MCVCEVVSALIDSDAIDAKRHTKNSAKDFQLQICLILNSVKLHFATTKKVTRTEVWWLLSCCCCSCLLIIIIKPGYKSICILYDEYIRICIINITRDYAFMFMELKRKLHDHLMIT